MSFVSHETDYGCYNVLDVEGSNDPLFFVQRKLNDLPLKTKYIPLLKIYVPVQNVFSKFGIYAYY